MSLISRTAFIASLAAVSVCGAERGLNCIEPQAATGASSAVSCSERAMVYTSQLLGDAQQPAAKQASALLHRMRALLREAGHAEAQPLRLEWVLANEAKIADIQRAMKREFDDDYKPTVSLVRGRLSQDGVSFALNGIYALPPASGPEKVGVKQVGQARVSILPAGGTAYVSGQAVQSTNTQSSATLTLSKLMGTLDFLKLTRLDVVQFKVFLQPITETGPVMAAMAGVYGNRQAVPPVVFVEWLGKPSLEIEMVVASPAQKHAANIEYLTPPGMTASPVFSRVARVNSSDRVFFSTLTSAADGTADAQAVDIFGQLGRLLTAAGSSFQHLAKATYYVTDDAASKALNDLRPRYFDPKRPPAASKALVIGTAVPGRTLALDMIAVPAR